MSRYDKYLNDLIDKDTNDVGNDENMKTNDYKTYLINYVDLYDVTNVIHNVLTNVDYSIIQSITPSIDAVNNVVNIHVITKDNDSESLKLLNKYVGELKNNLKDKFKVTTEVDDNLSSMKKIKMDIKCEAR